jgi:putative chitinase
MITAEQFAQIFPHNNDPQGWVNSMTQVFPKYGIDQPHRIAAFLAQCGHESAGWSTFEENLNYSAEGLCKIFGSHFHGMEDAQNYARQPELIANRIYANRMGNGPEESGDGWKYRGRGPIQLTGKENYTKFAQDMFDDWQNLVEHPDWVTEDKDFALMSAIWFWNAHNLNQYADAGDIKTMTKIINGGYLGLEERQNLYNTIIQYV